MTEPFFSTPQEAAIWWASQGVPVVPVLPHLFDNGGKKGPKPYADWKWDDRAKPRPAGLLTSCDEVAEFWAAHPEAQIAIVLGDGVGAIDVDLAKLSGEPPADRPRPMPLGDGLRESTKSKGEHILFRYRTELPPNRPTRVIGIGGYVDILCGGLLFTAPSKFDNSSGCYEVAGWGPIPEFMQVADALAASAPWLVPKWKERMVDQPPPSKRHAESFVSLAELKPRVEHALAAIGADPEIARLFHQGHPKPNGEVDRSQTEFRLAGFLKRRGVAEDVAWQVVNACPYTKSPRDRRGLAYFRENIWARLESPRPAEERPAAPPGDFVLTEFGNADRLLAARGGQIHYDVARQKWLAWDGRRWSLDDSGIAGRWAEEVLNAILAEAEAAEVGGGKEAQDRAEGLRSWWRRSSTDAKIASTLAIAARRSGVAVLPDDLDPDPWLLTVLNGTLDLRTGELQPHRPEDLITRLAPVNYNPKATCPNWERFILSAMCEVRETADFLQCAVGYSLSGSIREQVFFINWGAGRNGKSTFNEALRAVLGDYAWHSDSSTFLRQETVRVRQDLAVLRGVRLCTTSEIEDGQRLDEDLVKAITGGDPIQARHLFSRTEALFHPELKLWIAVNHKPGIRGQDDGIWRRVVLIPWEWQIPPSQVDKDFAAKLAEEREGILAWAVSGCVSYQGRGLVVPEAIAKATREFRSESDALNDFIETAFDMATKGSAERDRGAVASADAYAAYKSWCSANGERALAQRWFGTKLKERGFLALRNGTKRYWSVSLSTAGVSMAAKTEEGRREDFQRGYQ